MQQWTNQNQYIFARVNAKIKVPQGSCSPCRKVDEFRIHMILPCVHNCQENDGFA